MISGEGICRACGETFAWHRECRRGRAPQFCSACKGTQKHRRAYFRDYLRHRYQTDEAYRLSLLAARRANPPRRDKQKTKIRRAAREEARERGVPTEQVLSEWGA